MITLNSQESILTLTYSMRKVSVAEHFYNVESEYIQIPVAKEIFRQLLDDEYRHHELMRGLFKQIESRVNSPNLEMYRTIEPQERIEDLFDRHKEDTTPSDSEKDEALKALRFALIIEQRSFNSFSETACELCDNDVADVYLFLAGEDNKHYNMIKNAMDYVGNPLQWLYNTGNLVYRSG